MPSLAKNIYEPFWREDTDIWDQKQGCQILTPGFLTIMTNFKGCIRICKRFHFIISGQVNISNQNEDKFTTHTDFRGKINIKQDRWMAKG